MGNLKILKGSDELMGSRDLKVFAQMIESQWGKVPELFSTVTFIKGKDRIFIVSRELERLSKARIRVNSSGLYVAEVKGDNIRLSIEGSQLVGPTATKNVCDVSRDQVKDWFQGKDIQVNKTYDGFVILKYEDDFVGSGRFKDGFILNFVPKARRLIDIH